MKVKASVSVSVSPIVTPLSLVLNLVFGMNRMNGFEFELAFAITCCSQ